MQSSAYQTVADVWLAKLFIANIGPRISKEVGSWGYYGFLVLGGKNAVFSNLI